VTEPHPVQALDDTVHQRMRLGILSVLRSVPFVEFTTLKKTLALSDGNLASHLSALQRAGLVVVEKSDGPKRARTTAAITSEGRAALEHELNTLEAILAAARGDQPRRRSPASTSIPRRGAGSA
jgi:DNA-binding HxlR family transcriptional regulator